VPTRRAPARGSLLPTVPSVVEVRGVGRRRRSPRVVRAGSVSGGSPGPSPPGCEARVPAARWVRAKRLFLSGKSVFGLEKAVAILEESVRPLSEPVVEVVLLPGAFVGGSGVLPPSRGAGRGAAGGGGGRRGPASWHGAAGHGALQRWGVHVLQEGCQRGVPRGRPGGAAGTGRAEGRRAGQGLHPAGVSELGFLPASPVPLLGGWDTPRSPYLSPRCPPLQGQPLCHVPSPARGAKQWLPSHPVPAPQGASGAPSPGGSGVLAEGVPEPYAPRLHGDPHHPQSAFGISWPGARVSRVASGSRERTERLISTKACPGAWDSFWSGKLVVF